MTDELKARERAARGMINRQYDTDTHREQWPLKHPAMLTIGLATLAFWTAVLWTAVLWAAL